MYTTQAHHFSPSSPPQTRRKSTAACKHKSVSLLPAPVAPKPVVIHGKVRMSVKSNLSDGCADDALDNEVYSVVFDWIHCHVYIISSR